MNYIDQLKVKGIIYSLKDASVAALVNAKILELIGTAPENLDTLQELAAALLNKDDALEGIITTLASKTSKEYVDNLFNTIQLTPGPKGDTGEKGDKGDTGADGKSAYEIYKSTVNEQEAQPAIYAFESWNNSSKEVKYGEGQAKVVEMRAGGATIEVISNTSTDPNAEDFVGRQFNIATGLATSDPIQLYTTNNEPVDIWVTVELVSEAQEAVVAMTESEWLASLKGANGLNGANGKSAYLSYLDTTSDDPVKTEVEWLASLNGTVDTTNFYTKSEVDSNIRNNIGNIGRIDTNETYTALLNMTDPMSGESETLEMELEVTGETQEYNSVTLSALAVPGQGFGLPLWTNIEEALASESILYILSMGGLESYGTVSLTLLSKGEHRDKYVSEVINELDEAKLDKTDKFSGSYADLTDKPDQLIEDNELVIAWALNDLKAKYDDLLTRIQALENV